MSEKIQSWADAEKAWKSNTDRVARKTKAASEPAPPAEPLPDPITGEPRAIKIPALTDSQAYIKAYNAKREADVKASALEIEHADALAHDWDRGHDARQAAKRAEAVAKRAASRGEPAAVRDQQPDPSKPPSADARPVEHLRWAVEHAKIGRLNPGDQLHNLLNELASVGPFARVGRASSAAVIIADRETGRYELGRRIQSPGRREVYSRLDLSIASDLADARAIDWLYEPIRDLRDSAAGRHLPILVVVAESAVPEDLKGLTELAERGRCGVVLVDPSVTGWKAL